MTKINDITTRRFKPRPDACPIDDCFAGGALLIGKAVNQSVLTPVLIPCPKIQAILAQRAGPGITSWRITVIATFSVSALKYGLNLRILPLKHLCFLCRRLTTYGC
jgi:hypothetical protein